MSDESTTYIPALWLHARVAVRRKGTEGPVYMLRRLRLAATRETSTVQLLPVEMVLDVIENWFASQLLEDKRGLASLTLAIGVVEDQWEPTGKVYSILTAPL
jgi:hypothetical protein